MLGQSLFVQHWAAQRSPQFLDVPLQRKPQRVPSHVAVPPLGAAHWLSQAAPQLEVLVLLWQVPLHSWKPDEHLTPQRVPSQVALPPVGIGHASHELPQEETLLLSAQIPLQSCVPPEHWPSQARSASMHVPAHNFLFAGHFG